MNIHLALEEKIKQCYGEKIEKMELKQNALIINFYNGLTVDLRYLTLHEYFIGWYFDNKHWQVDTAPMHKTLGTFPNHMHTDSGHVVEDSLTHPGESAWDNTHRLLDAILKSPSLYIPPVPHSNLP